MKTATIVLHDIADIEDKVTVDCYRDLCTRHGRDKVHIVTLFPITKEQQSKFENQFKPDITK